MNFRFLLPALAAALLKVPGGAHPPAGHPTVGRIVRKDPRLDQLVPKGARLEVVASGLGWVEGPVWKDGSLLFSDIPRNAVFRYREGAGVSRFLDRSGYSGAKPFDGPEPGSNGLTLDAEGRLVLCQHGDRRIARLERDGTLHPLVERYRGKRLNSPNDLVFARNGDLLFTDPPFGLPTGPGDPARELDFSGVYRLTPGGELSLLTGDVPFPNGLALSPDEKTLYVSNADAARAVWLAFDMKADGSLGPGRVLFDATRWSRPDTGNPDGMKVDERGNLFAAGPGGVHVFAPDGSHLGTFETGVRTSNVAWGEDGSVLYVTADTTILRVRLTTRGRPS